MSMIARRRRTAEKPRGGTIVKHEDAGTDREGGREGEGRAGGCTYLCIVLVMATEQAILSYEVAQSPGIHAPQRLSLINCARVWTCGNVNSRTATALPNQFWICVGGRPRRKKTHAPHYSHAHVSIFTVHHIHHPI